MKGSDCVKVLIVDINVVGHHPAYIEQICKINTQLGNEVFLLLPEKISVYKEKTIVNKNLKNMKSFLSYISVMKEIESICGNQNIKIVHFLTGDVFYRFFGYRLKRFKKIKTLFTFHHFKEDFLHTISMKRILSRIDLATCHTDFILSFFKKRSVTNLYKITYPFFGKYIEYDSKLFREEFCIKDNEKIYLCLGETRYEKGLDIFLNACKGIENIKIIVAGKERDFCKKQLSEIIFRNKIEDKVIMILRYITDDELNRIVDCSDYIVIPYRRRFDGASGPLVEGVVHNKCIIGPNHGSLGNIISSNELGYCFESEDTISLRETIVKTQNEQFVITDSYRDFQESLKLSTFTESYIGVYNKLADDEFGK